MLRPFAPRGALLAALLLVLAGCGSSPVPTPSVALRVTPERLTIRAGERATARVTLEHGGSPGAVTLASPNLPAELDVVLTPDAPQAEAAATVSVRSGTAPGTYLWRLRATAALASDEVVVPVEVPAVADTSAPEVRLRSERTAVSTPSTVTLSAEVSDNVGVVSVALYRGGVQIASRTKEPWTFPVNLSKTDNGQPQFAVKATDAAGNWAFSPFVTLDVHIDIAAPTVTVTSATTTAQPAYRLTGAIQAEASVRSLSVALNGAAPHDVPVSSLRFEDTLTLAPGANQILVTATDNTGLVGSVTHQVTYTPPDTEPPTIRLESGASGTLTTPAPLTLSAIASDNRAIRDVTFVLDGAAHHPLATVSAAPYTATFRPFSVPNGVHTLTATATDTSGLTATAHLMLTVDIEREGPRITVTSPGIIEDGAQHVLTGTVSDPSGVVAMRLRPAGGGPDLPGLIIQDGTFSVPLPVPVGHWRYVLFAEDGVGNVSSLDTAVNNRGPDLTPPAQQPVWVPDETVAYTNPFAVVTRAQDDRGLARVDLLVDGRVSATREVPPHVPPCTPPVNGIQACSSPDPFTPPEVKTVFTAAFTAADNGPHTLQVRATDAAGNVSTGPALALRVAIDPAQPQRPPASHVGGRIFGWPGSSLGTHKVRLEISDPAGDALHALAETSVGADQRFAFPLPTATGIAPFLTPVSDRSNANCTADLAISDPLSRISGNLIFTPINGRALTGLELRGVSPDGLERRGLHFYADRTGTYQGSMRCVWPSGYTENYRYDFTLTAGWNIVVMDRVPMAAGHDVRYSNGSLDGLYWEYH